MPNSDRKLFSKISLKGSEFCKLPNMFLNYVRDNIVMQKEEKVNRKRKLF